MLRVTSFLLLLTVTALGQVSLAWPCSCGEKVLTLEKLSKQVDTVVVAQVEKAARTEGIGSQRPYIEIKILRRLKGVDQDIRARVWGGHPGECVSGLNGLDPGTTWVMALNHPDDAEIERRDLDAQARCDYLLYVCGEFVRPIDLNGEEPRYVRKIAKQAERHGAQDELPCSNTRAFSP